LRGASSAKEAKLDDQLIERLRSALERRNFLVHDYFRERITAMASFAGPNKLLNELEEMCEEFKAVDAELEAVTVPLLARVGVSEDVLTEVAERLKTERRD
jgi:hypothetical protein